MKRLHSSVVEHIIAERNLKLVVIGQGYVGLPLAMRAVTVGMSVVGFDVDQSKVDKLLANESYIDDVTDDDIDVASRSGRYFPTSNSADLEDFDFAVITVPTPLKNGAPDLSYIESASRLLGERMTSGCTVILESTTYPGTTQEFVAPILESLSGLTAGIDFSLGFSPERIDPGNKKFTFQSTPKVVSGINQQSLQMIDDFYSQLVDKTVRVSGTKEAELTKLLENTFRHVNIALVNELAMHAHALGIDVWESIRAASTKPFGFMPFYPGPGVGGHCLPIDPSYLSWRVRELTGEQFQFVETANTLNAGMPSYVVRRVIFGLNQRGKAMMGARVLVIGVAYKKNSNDARETPSVPLIQILLDLGAKVQVCDPLVVNFSLKDRVDWVTLSERVVSEADVVVIMTDHDELDWLTVSENGQYVFDTRYRLSGANIEHL